VQFEKASEGRNLLFSMCLISECKIYMQQRYAAPAVALVSFPALHSIALPFVELSRAAAKKREG